LSKRKDDAAMKKAMELMEAHPKVVAKLKETGHLKAAKNVEDKGGRWDSPETKKASGRDGGRG